jgi:hypothetical protein
MQFTSSVVQVIIIIHLHLAATAQVSSRTGSLAGLVLDPQSAPVSAATITATNADTNQARQTKTNERGEFLLPALPSGPYSLKIEAPGFTGKEYPEILLTTGQTITVTVNLTLLNVSEKLEVVEDAPVLDTTATTNAVAFGYERMEHSSAQGRNYVNFVLTAPGMSPAAGQSTGRSPASTWNANNDSGFVSNGIRSRNNSVSIDGTDNRDETTGAIRVSVPLEMVQELRIAGTTVSADLGGAAGGVVNIITRSGSNALHGHAEFLFQNEALNARNPEFLIPGRPYMRRTQPGFSASGPITKDRTFFAVAMEIYRENCDEWSEGFLGLRSPFTFRAGERDYQYSGKLQHIFNPVHTATLRYAYSLGRVNRGVQGIENHTDLSARGNSRISDHGFVGTLLSALRPTLINNFTFQYARRDAALTPNSRDPFIEIPGVMSFGQSWKLDQARNENHLELVNSLTWVRGRNTLSFGGTAHHVHLDGRLANRFQSITVFPTLAAYQGNRPDFQIQAFGNPATNFATTPIGAFLNNRWQARRGLTLETGLRYDYQFMPAGINTSQANFAPRVGLAWHPNGDSKIVFRLAAGLFFDRYPLAYLNEAIQKNGTNAYERYTYPALAFDSTYRTSANMPSTYGAKLTASAERQLNRDTTLAAEYAHVRGIYLPRIRNAAISLPAAFLLEQNASSTYDGVTLTLSRKMTSEFGYLLSYTGGRTNDDGSDYDEHPQDPRNLRAEWARSRQHQAHRVTATALYEWREIHLVPTFTYGSGRPLPALETGDVFRTAAFPLSARANGLPRNPFLTPGNASLDMRLFKLYEIEKLHGKLQVGLEAYNILNRTNPIRFLNYYAAQSRRLANHGEPIEFSSARQLQLFLHFEF